MGLKVLGEALGFIVVGMLLGALFDHIVIGMLLGLVLGVPLEGALAWVRSRSKKKR